MTFYWQNLSIPALILAPNLVFLSLRPKDKIVEAHESLLFVILERTGQVGILILPLFIQLSLSALAIFFMTIFLALYYIVWVRYFTSREARDLYHSFFHVPIPLAVFPILYFLFATLLFGSILYSLAFSCLAAGHLTLTYRASMTYK